jgi:O-methyltransferase
MLDRVDIAMSVKRRFPNAQKYIPASLRHMLTEKFLPGDVVGRKLATEVGTSDLSPEVQRIIDQVWPFTMTSKERLAALTSSIEYVVASDIPGAIVECGLWRGGSLLAAVLRLRDLGVADRDIWGFDTFYGMTAPTDADADYQGKLSPAEWFEEQAQNPAEGTSERDIRSRLQAAGYPPERIKLVAGKVEDTIPANAPAEIALLRLDTDWYESTLHELEHLYPRLAVGGILIIDDYGHYQGCKKAVDEYFAGDRIFLQRIDYTGRVAVKQGPRQG